MVVFGVRRCPSSVPEVEHPVSRRIYLQDGMIPKYTGWVPGESSLLCYICYGAYVTPGMYLFI